MGWGVSVHSVLQCGGMDGGTAVEMPEDERDGTDCPENAGSSPAGESNTKKVCKCEPSVMFSVRKSMYWVSVVFSAVDEV